MKTIYETLGGTYRQTGDYLLPAVACTKSANLGIWGQRRARYLREYKKALYFNMLTNGTLNDHLEKIDKSACEMFEHLVQQMKQEESLTEQLKATDSLDWVRRMNSIRNRAEETVYKELIYA